MVVKIAVIILITVAVASIYAKISSIEDKEAERWMKIMKDLEGDN